VTEPEFLTLDEVLAIHADQLRRYGGAPGIRDLDLLRSALAMPETSFDGE
jgi:death-on-curing protein